METNYLYNEAERTMVDLYPADDSELRDALEQFGGFETTDFERVGDNVVIADGAIVVALKFYSTIILTLYVIEGSMLPIPDGMRYGIEEKNWAAKTVMRDIREAERRILMKKEIINFNGSKNENI